MGHIVLYYLAAINLVTFLIFGIDKIQAKRNGKRVPEGTLLSLCAIGGSIGGFLAMQLIRHKTKHKKFTIGVPLIILLQIAIAVYMGFIN